MVRRRPQSGLDEDTAKIVTEAEHVKSMLNSIGWGVVFEKLQARLLDLQNINNLDTSNINEIAGQIAARKMAVELIYEWLRQDVHGSQEYPSFTPGSIVPEEEYIGRI
jgi:hypothetical protein